MGLKEYKDATNDMKDQISDAKQRNKVSFGPVR